MKAVNVSCCNNDKSSRPLPPFLYRHVYTVCIMCSLQTSHIIQWHNVFKGMRIRVLITTTNKLRSGKDNLPLYVQVENLLQLYYQNMFCRKREVSKHWHLVKHFSNGCQGLLFHYSLRCSQKRWGQITAPWKSLTGLLQAQGN